MFLALPLIKLYSRLIANRVVDKYQRKNADARNPLFFSMGIIALTLFDSLSYYIMRKTDG